MKRLVASFQIVALFTLSAAFCRAAESRQTLFQPPSLYENLFKPDNKFSYLVNSTTFLYENDQLIENKKSFRVECTMQDVTHYPTLSTSWVKCLGNEYVIEGRYIAGSEGIWKVSDYPQNEGEGQKLASGTPWLTVKPKSEPRQTDSECRNWTSRNIVRIFGGVKEQLLCAQTSCNREGAADAATTKTCFKPGLGPVFHEMFEPAHGEDYLYTALLVPPLPDPVVYFAPDTQDHGHLSRVLNFISRWAASQNTGDFKTYSQLYDMSFEGLNRTARDKKSPMTRKNWLDDREKQFMEVQQVIVRDLKITSIKEADISITFTQFRRTLFSSDKGRKKVLLLKNGDKLIISKEEISQVSTWDGMIP